MVQEEPSGRAALGVLMGPDEPLGKGCAVQLRASSGGSVILHFYPQSANTDDSPLSTATEACCNNS